jgi:DNA-binding NarL/FixJ family response regulator
METSLSALLVTSDSQSLFLAERTLDAYSIERVTCSTGLAALDALRARTFDLLVLDVGMPGSSELLDSQLKDNKNCPSTVIALTQDPKTVTETVRKRVHYVLQQPFTVDMIARTLKTAYGLIAIDKRTSFRLPVRIAAAAEYQKSGQKYPLKTAMLTDISQTGMCLKSDILIPKESTVFVNFQIPGVPTVIHAIGTVIWHDAFGQAGIQFRFIPPQEFRVLRDWLNAKCPWNSELVSKEPAYRMVLAPESARTERTAKS